jgi:hypothetical protein
LNLAFEDQATCVFLERSESFLAVLEETPLGVANRTAPCY